MGCPAGSDDAVRRHKRYKRWVYRREVEESARIGRAPDRLRFEDEEDEEDEDGDGEPSAAPTSSSPSSSSSSSPSSSTRTSAEPGLELRCKKCRRVLATKPFVVPHGGGGGGGRSTCPHVFVEPLSWMRPVLEEGALEGRLVCPNERCRASVGRYAWQGFQCSCGEWVCPAFSLQRGRVDEVVVAPARTTATRTGDRAADVRGGAQPQPGVVGAAEADRMAALGIRLPPGVGASGVGLARRGNL
ncbi:hypothetical protein VTK73DRAFT_10329 [Phialemonium thermophilum]|uniref:protein-tyrosine-phosphatase n=1 Tax=Phialemonium thermophilum TaxID=223376 RepID=A0ABR3VXJ5_9PEZI